MSGGTFSHPLLVDTDHHSTVFDFLRAGVERWPDATWCRTPHGDCSRSTAWSRGARVAAALQALDVQPGDIVLVALPNGLDFVYTWFGAVQQGAVVAALNPKALDTELKSVIEALHPTVIITDAPLGESPIPVLSPFETAGYQPTSTFPGAERTPADPVSLIQSSGSTGKPKYVIETNEMYTLAAEGFPFWLDLSADDVMMTTLPLSHINAQAYSMHASFGIGAQLVLLPKFSASTFWTDALAYGVTQFNAIGAMIEILMNQPVTEAERANKVKKCYSAPTPTRERHQEIETRFGLRLVMGYALSESPYGLVVPAYEDQRYEVMGKPRQHPRLSAINSARVVSEGGDLCPDGVMGELQLQNPAISPGYLGRSLSDAGALTDDGWLRTGDIATRTTDGYFVFQGRSKEIIRHKGENLSPVEVEQVLDAHPAVAISAVVGVPSPLSEEDIKAYVQLSPGATPSVSDLDAWCAKRLPPYKLPLYYEFLDVWPLTETQKIAKNRLDRARTPGEVKVR